MFILRVFWTVQVESPRRKAALCEPNLTCGIKQKKPDFLCDQYGLVKFKCIQISTLACCKTTHGFKPNSVSKTVLGNIWMNFYCKSPRWHGNSIRNGGRVRGSRARRSVSRLPTLWGAARMRVFEEGPAALPLRLGVEGQRWSSSPPAAPPAFRESSTCEPAGQRCPHWPLWSVAKWRLPLPDQTQHLLFAGQLASFPASRGQGSSWSRMFSAFFRPAMDANRPWTPSEATPERGIKQISLFFIFFAGKGMDECNHL